MISRMRDKVQYSTDVIDFNGTNKIPEIKGLMECRKEIMTGVMNVWYEYVPKCYDGSNVYM